LIRFQCGRPPDERGEEEPELEPDEDLPELLPLEEEPPPQVRPPLLELLEPLEALDPLRAPSE